MTLDEMLALQLGDQVEISGLYGLWEVGEQGVGLKEVPITYFSQGDLISTVYHTDDAAATVNKVSITIQLIGFE